MAPAAGRRVLAIGALLTSLAALALIVLLVPPDRSDGTGDVPVDEFDESTPQRPAAEPPTPVGAVADESRRRALKPSADWRRIEVRSQAGHEGGAGAPLSGVLWLEPVLARRAGPRELYVDHGVGLLEPTGAEGPEQWLATHLVDERGRELPIVEGRMIGPGSAPHVVLVADTDAWRLTVHLDARRTSEASEVRVRFDGSARATATTPSAGALTIGDHEPGTAFELTRPDRPGEYWIGADDHAWVRVPWSERGLIGPELQLHLVGTLRIERTPLEDPPRTIDRTGAWSVEIVSVDPLSFSEPLDAGRLDGLGVFECALPEGFWGVIVNAPDGARRATSRVAIDSGETTVLVVPTSAPAATLSVRCDSAEQAHGLRLLGIRVTGLEDAAEERAPGEVLPDLEGVTALWTDVPEGLHALRAGDGVLSTVEVQAPATSIDLPSAPATLRAIHFVDAPTGGALTVDWVRWSALGGTLDAHPNLFLPQSGMQSGPLREAILALPPGEVRLTFSIGGVPHTTRLLVGAEPAFQVEVEPVATLHLSGPDVAVSRRWASRIVVERDGSRIPREQLLLAGEPHALRTLRIYGGLPDAVELPPRGASRFERHPIPWPTGATEAELVLAPGGDLRIDRRAD